MPNVHKKSFVELSHPIEDGMVTYKGLPAPVVSEFRGRRESRQYYANGAEFHIGKIEMVGNTGTYIDSPFHRFEGGTDLAGLPLESIANIPGIVISAENESRIDVDAFAGRDLANKAVLVHTAWSRHWRSDRYFEDHPYLTAQAAEFLASSGVALVGIDSVNIDDMDDKARPVHTVLLRSNIPIVEHLTNLAELPESGFRFFAVPAPVKAFSSFPVRAFAIRSE
jgi:kynurenine formamidase